MPRKKIKIKKNGNGEEYQVAGNFIQPCCTRVLRQASAAACVQNVMRKMNSMKEPVLADPANNMPDNVG